MSQIKLPYGRQSISEQDISAVVAALRSEMLTGGSLVAEFEKALATYCGAKEAVVCSNGTAALHLAAMTLDLKAGDAVIVPSITFLATANAIRYVGAEVVFSDVDPTTGLMTPATLEAAIEKARKKGLNVRAVIPVHYAGLVADIYDAAQTYGLTVIEDAAHAIGSTHTVNHQKHYVGDCHKSLMTTFSFHPVKNMTTGEGGAIMTNDVNIAKRLRTLRNHGMIKENFQIPHQALSTSGTINPWYYEMHEFGYNYRLTDIQCALGLSQLSQLDKFVERRSTIVSWYNESADSLSAWMKPLRHIEGCSPAWHLYVALIDYKKIGKERGAFMSEMSKRGVGTQVHYLPVNQQPYYENRYGREILPGADQFYDQILSLPLFPAMERKDVSFVVETLKECFLLK